MDPLREKKKNNKKTTKLCWIVPAPVLSFAQCLRFYGAGSAPARSFVATSYLTRVQLIFHHHPGFTALCMLVFTGFSRNKHFWGVHMVLRA